MKNKLLNLYIAIIAAIAVTSCTDLSENVFSSVMSENYYQTKMDIVRAVYRPFEHCFAVETTNFETEQESADQMITPTRDNAWTDDHRWERQHRHQWNIDEGICRAGIPWNQWYKGIGLANLAIEDISKLDPEKFDCSIEEFNAYMGQLRCVRAYFYWWLFNGYRNLLIVTSTSSDVNLALKQVPPKEFFDWFEKELLEIIEILPAKEGENGNGVKQGSFTKAAAATLLVRLYLNAEKYIGEQKYEECIRMCERITSGEFGYYAVGDRWDEAFDWNNDTSNEVIFAYPATFGGTRWHTNGSSARTIYWRCNPHGAEQNFQITSNGTTNPMYALSPSFDNDGTLFPYKLGMVTQKFEKYPGDIRYKQYKNLGNNTREGMFFLEGYVINTKTGQAITRNGYNIYLLDRVGTYRSGASTKTITGESSVSTMLNGDFCSGLYVVKYPFYPEAESGCLEEDYTVMRLPEIFYSEAESYLRLGDARKAGELLNSVRKRNYPQDVWSKVLYAPEGQATLNMEEMLDEWGREFLCESRRRTDLIRFNRFGEAWWDKEADADSHFELFPLRREVLQQNKNLRQNPGYEDIAR